MRINSEVFPITNKEQLKKMHFDKTVEFIGKAVGIEYDEIWDNKHSYVQPGCSKSGIVALYIKVSIINEINAQDFVNVFKEFLNDVFKEENVLSVKLQNSDDIICHALVFPLNGRVLSGEKWLNLQKNNLKEETLQYFFSKIKESLNITIDNEVSKQNNVTNQAYQAKINLIGDMEIPEEDIRPDKEEIYDAEGMVFQEQFDMSKDRMTEIYANVLRYFTVGSERVLFRQAQEGNKTPEEYLKNVTEYIKRYYPNISESDKNFILKRIYTAVFGNDILEPLINDEKISDIKVLSPENIRVKVNGKRMTSNLHFVDVADYNRFIEGLAIRHGLSLNENAINPFTDKYSNSKFIMRFNITTPCINSVPFPYLHIRKIRKDKYTIEDLIRFQMMDRKVADYLIWKAKTGKGMVFCGKGASGKTTLVNTLIEHIPLGCSGLIIQESEELFALKHPDIMAQHIVTAGEYSGKNYTLQDEARNGLLTDLDYFIIGEIKGGEALYFLNAADTGHKCWCTVHAPNSRNAIDKLADYVMYEGKYNKEQAEYMLKELDTIIFMDHFKVSEISEIAGWDEEKKTLIYKTVYKR